MMNLFKKKRKIPKPKAEKEIAKNRQVRQKVVNQAIKESRNAVKIIGENGFTVGIFVAAGGKTEKGNSHAH